MSSTLGQLRIASMTQDEAEEIADWSYEPPYDFYDWRADDRDLAELLDPAQRGGRYFSAHNSARELIGFASFGHADDVVSIGLGLRPDLTGRGLGLAFLEDSLAFAKGRFAPRLFTLMVAEFNKRAIAVYKQAGFVRTRSFVHETNGGTFLFVEMERSA